MADAIDGRHGMLVFYIEALKRFFYRNTDFNSHRFQMLHCTEPVF